MRYAAKQTERGWVIAFGDTGEAVMSASGLLSRIDWVEDDVTVCGQTDCWCLAVSVLEAIEESVADQIAMTDWLAWICARANAAYLRPEKEGFLIVVPNG